MRYRMPLPGRQDAARLRWFEVIETRGHIENGRVAHYQVVIKVGFIAED